MVQIITAVEMQALLAKGEFDVVDIRNDREWAEGHIPGSRATTLDRIRANPDQNLPRSNIVFVCGQGLQSLTAAKLADRLGITEVYNLDGGINGWTQAGLELVTG
jgi:rhodanese-related sulfurtransferase